MSPQEWPILRAISDNAVLVEFGDVIDDDIHQTALSFDHAVLEAGFNGVLETVPAYTTVLVHYDPLKTDCDTLIEQLGSKLNLPRTEIVKPQTWRVPVCYAPTYASDLDELCDVLELTPEEVIKHHTAGDYKVYMYGFAPGFAYLGGVPQPLQIPRKQTPVKDIPIGSVMVAGPQSLIYATVMPSGWWNIGRTHMNPLQDAEDQPFLFNIGDRIEFLPVSDKDFLKLGAAQ